MKPNLFLWSAAALFALGGASAKAAPHVVVSIKPLHSLVAAIMDQVGEPDLIIQGAGSPHSYALKPSDAKALSSADVVFWIGPEMESFLEEPIETLAEKANVVALGETPGLTRLEVRAGGMFEKHVHDHDEDEEHDDHHDHDGEHDHDDHEHGAFDPHIWTDPLNARVMAQAVADTLAKEDPDNAAAYEANAASLSARLDDLIQSTRAKLDGLSGRPFIVFHDAYQGFENRFGISASGSITINPETAPGAKRIADIRDKIEGLGAVCVFAEPQFPPALVNTIAEGTKARTGILDPLGADLATGQDLYFTLIGHMADNLKACLEGS